MLTAEWFGPERTGPSLIEDINMSKVHNFFWKPIVDKCDYSKKEKEEDNIIQGRDIFLRVTAIIVHTFFD